MNFKEPKDPIDKNVKVTNIKYYKPLNESNAELFDHISADSRLLAKQIVMPNSNSAY